MPLILMKAHIDNYNAGCIYHVPETLRKILVGENLAVDYAEPKPDFTPPVESKDNPPKTKKRRKEHRVKTKYEIK